MKKLFLLILLICAARAHSQSVAVPAKVGGLVMPDSVGMKIKFMKNGFMIEYLLGNSRTPSYYLDMRDSGFTVANIMTRRILSQGLSRTIVQDGLTGDGQFFITGRPPGDSVTGSKEWLGVWYDSLVLFVPMRIVSKSTDAPYGGFLWRDGAGDTLKYSFGSSGVARISFSSPTQYDVMQFDGRVWKSTHKPEEHIGFLWASQTATDSQFVFEAPYSCTIDSIRVIETGATVTFNATRVHSGSSTNMLSSNYTITTSMTTASGIQNNTLVQNDLVYAVIKSITGTATNINVQFLYHITQ